MKKALFAVCFLVGAAHADPAAVVQPVGPAAVAQPEEPMPQHDTMQPLGEGVHIQPIVIPQEPPKKDLRAVYMGAGLVLIAAAFWWNRKQREKFDRSDVTTDEDKA